jgi:hypothetical protein
MLRPVCEVGVFVVLLSPTSAMVEAAGARPRYLSP